MRDERACGSGASGPLVCDTPLVGGDGMTAPRVTREELDDAIRDYTGARVNRAYRRGTITGLEDTHDALHALLDRLFAEQGEHAGWAVRFVGCSDDGHGYVVARDEDRGDGDNLATPMTRRAAEALCSDMVDYDPGQSPDVVELRAFPVSQEGDG